MFKIIPEFPKWEIDDKGLIRSVETKRPKYINKNHPQGYYVTQFKRDGKAYQRKIHRLVAELWLEPPTEELVQICANKWPYKVCVNHKDHDRTNNSVENLEWCDIEHNNKEAHRVGAVTYLKGSLNGRSLLTEDFVHVLCKSYEDGMSPSGAIAKYGISRAQATKIRAGHAWKHIWEQYDINVARRSTVSRKT